MVAVDTNFLVRLITGDSAAQAKSAVQMVEATAPNSLVVDRVVLAETLYVLRSNYKFSKGDALEFLTDVLTHRSFSLHDPEISGGMLRVMQDSNLSPEDACLAAFVAAGRADSIATFDQELLKYLSDKV